MLRSDQIIGCLCAVLGRCARVGCPGGLAVVVHGAAVSRAPPQFSIAQEQEQPPSNTGNKLPQPPPRKKKHPGSPGRPVAAVALAAPGVAGGCRGGPSQAAASCWDGRQHRTATAAYPVCCGSGPVRSSPG